MSASLEQIGQRVHSADEIHELFGAMRAMAAVRLQEAQGALPGSRRYADTIAMALADILPLAGLPPPQAACRPLLIAFMPEHGFVGGLVERLATQAIAHAGTGPVLALGDRGADVLEQHGVRLQARLPLGAHVSAAPAVVRGLVHRVQDLFDSGRIDAVDVLFARHTGVGSVDLVMRRLLPFEPPPPAAAPAAPLSNLPAPMLAEALLTEWVLGELVHALVETLASENGARLVAMDAARGNVESRLEILRGEYRLARQAAITGEIAEVVAGVLAQGGHDPGPGSI